MIQAVNDATTRFVVHFGDHFHSISPIVVFQPGIGTYFQPGVVSPLFTSLAKLADEAIAWYIYSYLRGMSKRCYT